MNRDNYELFNINLVNKNPFKEDKPPMIPPTIDVTTTNINELGR